MKIFHLLSAPTAGGAEIYVKDLALQFVRAGHEPVIGFLSRAADVDRSPDFESEFLAELEDAGVRHVFLGHECRRNPFLGTWRMRQLCTSLGVDIYHTHLKYGIGFASLLRVPRVYTHHNSLPDAPLWLYRLFNIVIDAYIGISEECARNLARYTRRPVTTIRNGIRNERIASGEQSVREFRRPIRGIAVGRVFEQKNYPLLVDALSLLPSDLDGAVEVSIVGEGPALPEVRERIERRQLGKIVTPLGNRCDIPDLLAQSDLFLMSSIFEGLPISLIEATVAGLPFIATDVGSCREVAELCGNGIIVPPNDASALAAAIEALLRDPERIGQLSRNAIDNSHMFDIETAAFEHLRLYRKLLVKRNLPRWHRP